mmetsp:Transcript_21353/g.49047  ORF Transcript_21353/g.49047 Transcript_21353/m.49047 type:complete len:85 (+) Transcript_21353:66-320(+)
MPCSLPCLAGSYDVAAPTTTTSMEIGMPWWTWFMVCVTVFTSCFLFFGGANDVMSTRGRRKKQDSESVPHLLVAEPSCETSTLA